MIRNVLLCGNKSKNGYEIPKTAFGDEAKVKTLYDELHVFINHLSQEEMRKQSPASRRLEELAGVVVNPRFVDGRPFGDIETSGCPRGEMLRQLATSRVRGVGLSHVAQYKFANPKRERVESVEKVFSVDVVVRPATTKTFMEQSQPMETELAELKVKLAQAEQSLAAKTTALATAEERVVVLTTEATALKAQVETYKTEAEQRQLVETVNAELTAAGLDRTNKDLCGEAFVSSLLVVTAEQRAALIADRKALIETVAVSESAKGGSGERKSKTGKETTDPVAAALSAANLFV